MAKNGQALWLLQINQDQIKNPPGNRSGFTIFVLVQIIKGIESERI